MGDLNKKKRRGRPIVQNARINKITVCYSNDELIIIKAKAKMLKRKQSSYVRISSLSNQIKFTITDEDRVQIRKLTGIANNINQMAKNSNIHGFSTLFQEFIELRNSIQKIIKKIQI